MKRTIKSITAVLVVLTLCLGLIAGCASNPIVGRWKAVSASAMGMAVDMDKVGSLEMEFYGDGTCIAYDDGEASGKSNYTDNGDGTYTVDGQTLTLKDGKLEMTVLGITVVFAK